VELRAQQELQDAVEKLGATECKSGDVEVL
jgi:hypothetical protein